MNKAKENWAWEYRNARELVREMGVQAYSDLYYFYGQENEDDLVRDKMINQGISCVIKNKLIPNGTLFLVKYFPHDDLSSNKNLSRINVGEIDTPKQRRQYLTSRPYRDLNPEYQKIYVIRASGYLP